MILMSVVSVAVCVLVVCSCRRLKYNAEDDRAILWGLLIDERYKKRGGNTVWKELEQLKVGRQKFC